MKASSYQLSPTIFTFGRQNLENTARQSRLGIIHELILAPTYSAFN